MSNTTKGGVQRLDLDQITLNGSAATCTGAEITAVCSGNTATAAEINAVADRSARIVTVTTSSLDIDGSFSFGPHCCCDAGRRFYPHSPAGDRDRGAFPRDLFQCLPVWELDRQGHGRDGHFYGVAILSQDAADTAVMFETAADTDTVTINQTTTGVGNGCLVELGGSCHERMVCPRHGFRDWS